MLKDITLGQFVPGNSPVHRMDPRTKLIMLIVYIVALFVASGWISYAAVLLFLAVSVAICFAATFMFLEMVVICKKAVLCKWKKFSDVS